MIQRVTPQQIKVRIEALVSEQKSKGYKTGWVWHRMNNLVQEKSKFVSCYAEGCRNLIPDAAQYVAEGGDIDKAMEYLIEMYEQDCAYELEALKEM